MRFIRENLFYSILIGLTVALGGGAVIYYFLSDVREKLQSRATLASRLRKLAREQKYKVNADTVDAQRERIEKLRIAAKKDAKDRIEFNRQELKILQLTSATPSQPAFPIDEKRYSDFGLFFVFFTEYTNRLKADLADPALKRTAKATEAEIRLAEQRWREQYKDKAYAFAIEWMRLQKAEAGMIYVEDGALDRHILRETKDIETLWQCQVNLWVTEQILQAIITTNNDLVRERKAAGTGPKEANVLSSAVKHLVKINVNEPFVLSAKGGFGAAARGTITQRISTGEYGVIRYDFTVVMPTRYVVRLMRNLMVQNYHTVVNVAMAELPRPEKVSYYYGTEPVMKVTITGEMLILLDWARPLMPEVVASKLPAAPASS